MTNSCTHTRSRNTSIRMTFLWACVCALAITVCTVPGFAVADAATSQAAAALELSVVPDAPAEGVRWGTDVRYEFYLSNPGAVTITDIVVDDTLCGRVGTVESLDPGASTVLYATAVITGTGQGTATAVGMDSANNEIRASADHFVDVYIAHDWLDYSVSKRAHTDAAKPGDVVTFSVVIQNLSEEPGEPGELELVDTFDPSLAVVQSAPGGVVGNGRIVWRLDGFSAQQGERVIEYKLRLRDSAAQGSTLRNLVMLGVVGDRGDIAPEDNVSSASVTILPLADGDAGDGFLPFDPSQGDGVSAGSGTSSAESASAVAATGSTTPPEPFLPFTGLPTIAIIAAALCASAGLLLRLAARRL